MMNRTKKGYNTSFFLFFLLTNIRYCGLGFTMESIPAWTEMVFILPVFVFGVCALLCLRYTLREFFLMAAVFGTGLLILMKTGQPTILLSTVALFAMKEIPVRKLLEWDMKIKTTIICTVIVLCICSVLPDVSYEKEIFEISVTTHSLGYQNPNTLGAMVLYVLLEYLYVSDDRSLLKRNLVVLAVGLVFSLVTGCRTLVFSLALCLLFSAAFHDGNRRMVSAAVLPLICTVPVVLSMLYDHIPNIQWLDQFLSGRIFLGFAYLNLYPISLFGSRISFEGLRFRGVPLALDSFYIRALLNFGVIFFLAYGYLFTKKYRRNRDDGSGEKRMQNMIILIILLCGLTESTFYNLWMNPAMVFLSELLYPEKESLPGMEA